MGFGIWDLGFGIWDLGFGLKCSITHLEAFRAIFLVRLVCLVVSVFVRGSKAIPARFRGMWNVECGMWNVECGMWNVEL